MPLVVIGVLTAVCCEGITFCCVVSFGCVVDCDFWECLNIKIIHFNTEVP